MNKKNYKTSISLLCTLIIFCTAIPYRASGKEDTRKHILLLSSYFPDKENSKIIINSFSQKLHDELDCRITVEYMDSESTTDFKDWKHWMTELFGAYKSPPDVVAIIGGEAWIAYSVTCPQAWKDIPIVLGSVKRGYIDYAHYAPQYIKDIEDIHSTTESFGDFKITGYYIKDYFKENLQLIKCLQPEVKKITYIYDNRYGFHFLDQYIGKMVKEESFERLYSFYGNELSTTQLIDSLESQDSSYAILSSGWYNDALHYSHTYSMLHNELSMMHSKFFYLIMDQGQTNLNYLGGYFVAAKDIGQDLAELTYTVLTKGIDNSPKFQITPSDPQYYINYKRLIISGIKESRLPPGAILYNKEPPFMERYFWQIVVVSLVIFTIILILILRMRSYKQVTAIKTRMMEEQKILREKADESNRLKSAFLANMSHEIRTPLNAIVGFSTQLSEAENKEEAKLYMDIIETNNALLLQLINDILDLSKIEAGTLDFIYSETDVVEICRNLEQMYLSRAKKDVSLLCEVPDKKCIIHTERNRVTQVISNFLSNAVKFTESGCIRFGYKHTQNGLYFYATDTGKGIANENLSKVFTRFEKFDKFVQGNGLGMSICKTIVEKMNGVIGVESELGKGSTFWFTLPCKIISTESIETIEKEEEPKQAVEEKQEITNNQKTILIAEDTESNFLLLSCILRNYHLKWVKDGKQAVEMHKQIHPDLILMDIKMPVMDGLEATSLIREVDKKVPIIVLTAYAYAEDKKKAKSSGCNAFLTKPINQNQLWEVLHKFGL